MFINWHILPVYSQTFLPICLINTECSAVCQILGAGDRVGNEEKQHLYLCGASKSWITQIFWGRLDHRFLNWVMHTPRSPWIKVRDSVFRSLIWFVQEVACSFILILLSRFSIYNSSSAFLQMIGVCLTHCKSYYDSQYYSLPFTL